jgi:glycosyltransferase involved in cell wall biosynthesis
MKTDKLSVQKVLIINAEIPWGGLGQYTINLAYGLTKEGFRVFGLVTHSGDGRYNEFAANTSGTLFVGNYGKFRRYIEIARYIWRLRPDYLLLNNNAPVQILLPFLPKCKVVSVIHSDDDRYYRISMINRRYVNAWVAPTQRIKDGLIQYAAHKKIKDRVKVIPHGVWPSNNTNGKRTNDTFNIVFIGYLHDYKGVDLLPDIFLRFRQICNDKNSHLTVIGGGDNAEILRERFKDLGLSQFVTMTGVISQEQVRSYLLNMDVLLFPTWLEAFGLVIAEAMIEGVVPVVSLLPGVTDTIIQDRVTGFLVEKNYIDGFVSALMELCNNKSVLSAMSKKCQSIANEKYSLGYMAHNYGLLFHMMSVPG